MISMDQTTDNLPVARTRNSVHPDDPSIIAGDGFRLPPVYYRAQRQVTALEEFIVFSSTNPVQIMNAGVVLRSRRYCRQVWFYGGPATTGSPAVLTPNVNTAVWGWSAQSMFNQVAPYAGVYGSLIQPQDGEVIDLWSIWLAGSIGDGLFISVL